MADNDAGLAALDAQIARLRGLAGFGRQAAPAVAPVVRAELERTIAAGQTAYGEPWEAKADGGAPLAGAAAALAVVPSGSTVVIQVRGPEARHHRGWVKGGRTRAIIPTKEIPPAMAEAIKRVLVERFEQVMAVSHG
jgi:hypothetical protein